MKIRMGFITNSSSTNFLIISKEELTEEYLFEKLGFIKDGMLEKYSSIYLITRCFIHNLLPLNHRLSSFLKSYHFVLYHV